MNEIVDLQMSNEMYTAFQSADSAMNTIKLQMSPKQLPDCINDIMQLIEEGTSKEICEELPGEIKKVDKILDSCIEKTDDIARKFDALMTLLFEVIRLPVTAQGASKNDVKKFENLYKSEEKVQDHLKIRMEEVKEEVETLKVKKEQEYRAYKDKLERMGDISFADIGKVALAGIVDAVPFTPKSDLADKILERSRTQMQMSRQDYLDAKEEMEKMKDKQLEESQNMLATMRKMGEYQASGAIQQLGH